MIKPVFSLLVLLAACSSETTVTASLGSDKPPAAVPAAPAMTAGDLAEKYRAGDLTVEEAVQAYLDRIAALDDQGPALQAVLTLNPNALEDARAVDAEAAETGWRGPLHGVPVLIKDNVETLDMPTTAGSRALSDNMTERDAPIVARLRAEGAIILGKTNLSEWANFRSEDSISGWSGLGGQTRNPYSLDRSPCGSSSGSGAAAAAMLAPLTIGTETNGSIICPSTMNGIVGFKPTVGLLPRTHIVPISSTQDTAGPMTRSVRDAAIMLTAMAGTDEVDTASADSDSNKTDYAAALTDDLTGVRIGVMRFATGDVPEVSAAFDEALSVLEEAGAVLVDVEKKDTPDDLGANEYLVLKAEFKATLNDYLANAAPGVESRSLADLIAFNDADERELVLFDQSIFTQSEELPGLEDETYQTALASILKATREDGIDDMLTSNDVDVLVAPTLPAAFLIDAVYGDNYDNKGVGLGWMAAIAGYPHITVPMGSHRGLPVGLSVMAGKWQDTDVLNVGYNYEQRSEKIMTPTFARGPMDVEATSAAVTTWQDTDGQ
ncbi:amidase [Parvularcula sp. LCG005]|uniref:amidase n=1 Tax=Parvularcula sp. LCG005 TaxID=3078805 RepID=UPI002941BFBA|nr:amidase [Parvularcula sp. LCG005]WOI53387.1 amidase [Parvularcula sp. LCG005]